MIEVLRYWGKQVHKFAEIWFAVISRLTAYNSEEFRCYSAAASSERLGIPRRSADSAAVLAGKNSKNSETGGTAL